MDNVTITEKYALCMLKEKKKFYESELTPHLVMSMIIEMMLSDNLEITAKNKVKLNDNEPSTEYNKQLYNIIKDMKKKEVDIKDIITNICYGFTSKKMKDVVESLKEEMIKSGLISLDNKKGIIRDKEIIVLNENEFSSTIEEIRAELLENGILTDDIILLGSLLNATKFLKNIFTKYEKDALNKRLEELKNTEIAKKVRIAQSVVDDMTVFFPAYIAAMATVNY